MRVAHLPSLWPNWIRRLTTNQKIGGSSPSRDIFYFLPAINQWKHALRVTGRSYHAWMPEWSKGADLRSAGQFVRLGSNPSPGSIWGISSIGRVRALQARGTGIETPMLHFTFMFTCLPFFKVAVFPVAASGLDGRAVQGARLKFESLRRRGFESHSKHFGALV